MFRRAQEALADVAETVRRLFSDVAVRAEDPRFPAPGLGGFQGLQVSVQAGMQPFQARVVPQNWQMSGVLKAAEVAFQARLQVESGWTSWAAERAALPIPLFSPGAARRMEAPALPRRAQALQLALEPFRVSTRVHREPVRTPGCRRGELAPWRPAVRRDLAQAFRRPFSFRGQAFGSLPKVLQMRYTVQLVKATGENIRDLEVVGLFRVPRKGMGGLRLDARSGALQAALGPEAMGAPKALLMLAKRRADQALLTCFLET